MINSFLATLQNEVAQPVNGASTVGSVLWPSPIELKSYSGEAAIAEQILFEGKTGLDKLLIAIQLLWVVEESVLADTISVDDPRITYTRTQLEGQFVSQSGWEQQTSRILQEISRVDATRFLADPELTIYRSSLSPLDRLAAVIAYFGARDD